MTALCLVTFFAGLGRSAIGDADEAFYAQSAREMVEQGDWITPHYNYEHRFQKPVFFYWLVAVAYSVAGVGEAAARFPSALAGLALALMTWAIGRRWVGPPTGVVGGAIVATSFGYFTIAHASLPDLPLASSSRWRPGRCSRPAPGPRSDGADGARHRVGRAGRSTRRWWMLLAGLAIGLGMLTKGPVALVLPALVYLSRAPGHGRRPAADAARLVRAALDRRRARHPRAARGRAAVVPGDGRRPRHRLPAALLHRREPRALRHRALQRPPPALVLRADRPRRPGAVVVADGALDAAARARAARRPRASPSWSGA